ncbi:MAG: (2Fe-2S) ferredoxin domain-containing protein, partial [Bacillota bacterium]
MGSSCFLRGSRDVVEAFKGILSRHGLEQRVILKGSFCMERCTNGVTVRIGDRVFTQVRKEDVPRLFEDVILTVLEHGSS